MGSDTGLAQSVADLLNVDEVFVLPHDDLAASGKLGPLSPLFNAYKELFQRLFAPGIAAAEPSLHKNL